MRRTGDGKAAGWVYGFHVAALFNVLLGALLWMFFKFPIYPVRSWSLMHILDYLVMVCASIFIVFLVDIVLFKNPNASCRDKLVNLKEKLSWPEFVWLLVSSVVSFEIVVNIHTNIKQLIPFVNSLRCDPFLARADSLLNFGTNLPLLLSSSDDPLGVNEVFDWFYRSWFYVQAIVVGYFLYGYRRYKCDLFLSSLFYVYGFGVALGVCFPSFGPFYMYKGSFPANGMSFCLILQNVLRTIADNVSSADLRSGSDIFFGYGLMAMPSLHVAVCFLCVLFFWGEHRVLRAIFVVYMFVIFIGSMKSGWHYSVDGYAAVPLVFFAVFCSRLTLRMVYGGARRQVQEELA